MRICLYTETALPRIGGQQLVVDALARHLRAAGHQVTVLTQTPRRPLKADDASLPYQVVRHPRFVSTRHFVAWFRRYLLKLHRQHHFDVVHCHSVYPTAWIAGLARKQLGVPVLITSHGGDVREGNPRLLKPALVPRHTDAIRRADALISMSNFTREGYLRLDPTCAPKITDIPNGVDLAAFNSPAPRPANLPAAIQPGKFLLFMGRLAHQKGVDVLIRGYSQAIRTCNGDPPHIVVAGEGDQRDIWGGLAGDLGVANNVHFVGRVEGNAKTYLFQNCAFVVMPSRRAEAFPLVVLEAYAASKPLIGTIIPGLKDLVHSNQTGLLIPEDNPAAMTAALQTFMQSPEKLRTMGSAARQIAGKMSWPAIAQRHVDLYEKAIVALRG